MIAGGVAAGISRLPAEPQAGATPLLRYGQERCAYCTMSIDDPRFASAWRTPDGAERHFDDIGCMVNAYRREGPPANAKYWVHDYRSEAWLDAREATYLVAPAIKTPMAYGVAAFATADAATATVPERATLAWADVLSRIERKG